MNSPPEVRAGQEQQQNPRNRPALGWSYGRAGEHPAPWTNPPGPLDRAPAAGTFPIELQQQAQARSDQTASRTSGRGEALESRAGEQTADALASSLPVVQYCGNCCKAPPRGGDWCEPTAEASGLLGSSGSFVNGAVPAFYIAHVAAAACAHESFCPRNRTVPTCRPAAVRLRSLYTTGGWEKRVRYCVNRGFRSVNRVPPLRWKHRTARRHACSDAPGR